MKVTATHWINLDGTWYRPGEVYDDGTPERAEIAEEIPQNEPEKEPVSEQPKRSRKRAAREA